MKKITPAIALLSFGLIFSGLAQENAPTAPLEKKPAAQKPKPKQTPAPNPKPKPKPAPPKEYVIQSGDNPWTIAKDHGVSHDELLKVNDIKDPKNLKIGDVLILPKGVASKNAPKKPSDVKPAVKPGPQSGAGWEMYTIKSGDNPWTISKKLNVDHQKILTLNEGLNFRDLKIGQQIKVPKKS